MIDPTGQETLESMSQAFWYNRWTLKKFDKYLKGRILEIGCGIGNFTKELTRYGDVYAIDTNNEYISGLSPNKNSKFEVGFGDIENGQYFFKNIKFDSAVCLNVLEHINNDSQTIKNIFDLLNPNGYLILIVPAHQFLFGEIDRSIGHYRRYGKLQIEQILEETGFSIKVSRKMNFLGGVGWFISSVLLKNKTVQSGKIRLFNLLAPIILPLEDLIEPPIGTSILVIAQKNK